MTNAEAIILALHTRDAKAAARLTERMRFGMKTPAGTPVRLTHANVLDVVARVTGRPVAEVGPEWETLLLSEADQ